jgi:hypothetical protein
MGVDGFQLQTEHVIKAGDFVSGLFARIKMYVLSTRKKL